jgi:hypothetical protein
MADVVLVLAWFSVLGIKELTEVGKSKDRGCVVHRWVEDVAARRGMYRVVGEG